MTYNQNIIEMAHVLSYCETINYGAEAFQALEDKFGEIETLDEMLCLNIEDEIREIVIELAGEYEIHNVEKDDIARIIIDFAFDKYNKNEAGYDVPFYYDREKAILECKCIFDKIDF